MYIEDQVATLSQQNVDTPFAWLICYQERPLQATPAGGSGAHLLLFSSQEKAAAYISGRQAGVGIEPLSTLVLPNAEALKDLTILPSHDTQYIAPPCGVMLDAVYAGGAAKVVPPAKISHLSPVELARELGLANGPVSSYAPDAVKVSPAGGSKKTTTIVLIVIGVVVCLCLCLILVVGGWYLSKNGGLNLPSLGSTPTYAQPTMAPYPTSGFPTAAPTEAPLQPATEVPQPTDTAEALATVAPGSWAINVNDRFTSNTNQWSIYTDNQDSMLKDSENIQNGKLTWQMEAVDDNVFAWDYPQSIPAVTDFEVSLDAQRAGSSDGDYGIIFRLQDNNDFCMFVVDDSNQQYNVACYQSSSGGWSTIVDWSDSSVILNGGINHLAISARGNHFVFSINGTKVGQADITGITSGQLGICADLYTTGDKMTITYDNFQLQGMKP